LVYLPGVDIGLDIVDDLAKTLFADSR
jgi:hypothetical protein